MPRGYTRSPSTTPTSGSASEARPVKSRATASAASIPPSLGHLGHRRHHQQIDREWAKYGGLANIGVSCGPANLVVLDEDQAAELDKWCLTYGVTLPDTHEVTTGRGRHLIY